MSYNICTDERVSCGEHALYYYKEYEAAHCQISNEMWHKHKSRRNHSVEVIMSNNLHNNYIVQQVMTSKTGANASLTGMDTNSGISDRNDVDSDNHANESFSFSGDDEFDSIVGTVDVNEATKTYLLGEKFGNTLFNDFQKELIDAVLNKKNCLVIQPTGKGKSLCYQFPALYTGKTTLVVMPTISLMHNQTRELKNKGIDEILIGSAQTDPNVDKRVFDVKTPASIIFVSPEWLFSKLIREYG